MIKSVQYHNFKALKDAVLPLDRFTLLLGANGSGKSTAIEGFNFVLERQTNDFARLISADLRNVKTADIWVHMNWCENSKEFKTGLRIEKQGSNSFMSEPEAEDASAYVSLAKERLASFTVFKFDADAIATEVETQPNPELGSDGSNLAAVLDALRDTHPEKFEELNKELHRWLPEFDRVLFRIPTRGKKTFMMRSTLGQYAFNPSDLSHGVLFALAFLTLAYLPKPPSIVCFEEPDRGIHPRLLMDIRDAMYRLAFPENYGEKREPVQVIATTHSPYLLDLFKEHPEQIVIAHKTETGVRFERLSEKPHLGEILEGAPLGDIWFSGILGGVPAAP